MSAKFLIIRFSALGDCVMAVPVAASIRKAMPDVDLCWAIEPRCMELIDGTELVSRLQPVDRQKWKREKWAPSVWREQMRVFSALRKERFDFGVDLQGHSKTALCLRIAAPKKRIAARATDPLVHLMNPVLSGDHRAFHTVDWNLRTLANLGEFSTEAHWVMPKLVAERALVADSSKPLVTIAVGSGHMTKCYPAAKWAAVARDLVGQNFRVAFLGGSDERAPKVAGCLDWVGKLSLSETMAAVASSRVHLSSDTGTAHIAAAYGVPVVTVFGPSDPKLFAPYTVNRVVLIKESKITADIEPEEILAGVRSLTQKNETALPR